MADKKTDTQSFVSDDLNLSAKEKEKFVKAALHLRRNLLLRKKQQEERKALLENKEKKGR